MSLTNPDLTWQFELRLHSSGKWVPVTADLAGDEYPELAGAHEMPEIWDDAKYAAPAELENALAGLARTADEHNAAGARIVVWEGIGTDKAPACVLEATEAQLTAGRLEDASLQVQQALREVEAARTQVRTQVIRASLGNMLSRNAIARLVSGALARRLVLQLLGGHDLVEGVRDALSWGHESRYRRWYPSVPDPEPDEEYLGPFCYGPVRLDLDPGGPVRLKLIDVDGYWEAEAPMLEEDDQAAARAERAYRHALAERAHGYAREVLPLLARAGFALRDPDGAAATVDDLARAISGPGLLVSDSS
jgi:hypothetical protein